MDQPGGYRLIGQLGAELLRFTLEPGANDLGSAAGLACRVIADGVSRRHARLVWQGNELRFEDLGSKNGSFLNEKQIARPTRIVPGDVIELGAVRLTLEALEKKDVDLAFELLPFNLLAEAPKRRELTAVTATRQVELSQPLGFLLDRLCAEPNPGPDAALRLALEFFGASGGMIFTLEDGAEPIVAALVGKALPVMEKGRQPFSYEFVPSRRLHECRFKPSGARTWGICIDGSDALPKLASELLRLLLIWLAAHQTAPLAVIDPQPPALPELCWPEGHLPGTSPAMLELYRRIRLLLRGNVPVLIKGESGVGKEHIARLIHFSSPRRHKSLVALNCAAIPAELLEAELFGIGKGVATGVRERVGKFVAAQGGTLLLDEIGDMPHELQAKLLRVLQENVVEPLGGAPVQLDVRLLAATHADLRARVDEGKFRLDLFYRLAGFELEVAPLRERREDLPALLRHFAQKACLETGKSIRGFTVRALDELLERDWPGNVRELEHEARRLVYLCPDNQAIDSSLLSGRQRPVNSPVPEIPNTVESPSFDDTGATDLLGDHLEPQLEALERRLIETALRATGGNQVQAAQRLGISRNGLILRLNRLGVDAASFRSR